MARLTFLGATGTVTGSRFLFESGGRKFLIDCGMFQGLKVNRLKNWEPFPVSPAEIEALFLTHAHIDHSGYLPRFCKYGFSGKIFATHPTTDLCEILLKDSGHLQEEDARWANKKRFTKHDPAQPLYTAEDAEKALTYFSPVHYGEDIFLTDNLRVKFKDAGHILGSAFIDIKIKNTNSTRRFLFSGDLGRPNRPILRDPVQAFEVDYLILESTYGNRLHEDNSPEKELSRIINESIERGGVLVIPSFAVGRTQELLFTLRELEARKEIPVVPVYVDSPMAIDATHIFDKHKGVYDLKSKVLELKGIDILHPKDVHFSRTTEQSRKINEIKSHAIIISASGMVTGGRILHHLANRLPNPANTILFIGFQAEGTRGRTILEGSPTVKIHGQQVPIKAKIENISGFSAHADYEEILAWLIGFNRPPDMTFIVHGEPEASKNLARLIKDILGWNVTIPEFGESFVLT